MNSIKDYIISFFSWLLVYLLPIAPLVLAIGCFVLCDFTTGLMAAKTKGEVLTSKKMRFTIYKFISYGVCIFVSLLIQNLFLNDLPIVKAISGFIIYVELKSINENIFIITGKNVFSSVLKKLKI